MPSKAILAFFDPFFKNNENANFDTLEKKDEMKNVTHFNPIGAGLVSAVGGTFIGLIFFVA